MDPELQELIDHVKIDPLTHPIFLYEFEWDLLMKMKRKGRLHLHKWVYRDARPLGDVLIVHNTADGGVMEIELANGRYCETCGRLEFLDAPNRRKNPDAIRWTQLDMIALGIR